MHREAVELTPESTRRLESSRLALTSTEVNFRNDKEARGLRCAIIFLNQGDEYCVIRIYSMDYFQLSAAEFCWRRAVLYSAWCALANGFLQAAVRTGSATPNPLLNNHA